MFLKCFGIGSARQDDGVQSHPRYDGARAVSAVSPTIAHILQSAAFLPFQPYPITYLLIGQ